MLRSANRSEGGSVCQTMAQHNHRITCFTFYWYGIFLRSKRSCHVAWSGPCSLMANSRSASWMAVSYASSCALSWLQCLCMVEVWWPPTALADDVNEEEEEDESVEVFVLFMMAVMASWRFDAISSTVRPPRKMDCCESTLRVGVIWANNSFAIFTNVLLNTWHISWIQCVSVNGMSTVAWMVTVSCALRCTSCVIWHACNNNIPPPLNVTSPLPKCYTRQVWSLYVYNSSTLFSCAVPEWAVAAALSPLTLAEMLLLINYGNELYP